MEDKEREIDLRKLVILIMMHWRIITCVTLICMTLGAFLVSNRSGIRRALRMLVNIALAPE